MTGGRTRPPGDGGSSSDEDGPSARPRPPRLGETLLRTLVLASADIDKEARRFADLVIEPRSPGMGLFEFHQIDQAIEAGRRAAREALQEAPSILWPATEHAG
jgi:NTE family protein